MRQRIRRHSVKTVADDGCNPGGYHVFAGHVRAQELYGGDKRLGSWLAPSRNYLIDKSLL
jgi:hypothetical protein